VTRVKRFVIASAAALRVTVGSLRAQRDRIGLGVAGAMYCLLRLYVPHATQVQQRTLAIALALAAGAAGGFIPGALAGPGKRPAAAVRATTAISLAVFILILFSRFIL
jgi:hypothetical protein